MPSVTRQARDDRHRTAVSQQVLEAVERLLARGESFTNLGIQRIAAEAGIARTTFYGYFRDKPTLLMALTESATTRLFEVASAWVNDDASTRAQLEATVGQEIVEYRKHAPLLGALTEVAGYAPEVAAYWLETINGFAVLIAERIVRHQQAGRIPAAVDATTTAEWIAWGTERTVAMHVAAHPDDPSGDLQLARGVAAATWAAMQYG